MKQVLSGLLAVLILASPVLASELVDEARETHDNALDDYRNDYQAFLLRREEFQEIDSFANQEALVEASKEMLLERADVWWTYWQAVRTELVEANGFDPEIKNALTGEIEDVQDDILAHEARLEELETREVLLEEAEWLNARDDRYRNLAFRSLTQLRLARFNWALTQLEAYVPTLQANIDVQIRNPQLKAARLRGLGEVENLLELTRDTLDETIEEELAGNIRDYENTYEDAMELLQPGYASLKRAQSLLRELSEGTEL